MKKTNSTIHIKKQMKPNRYLIIFLFLIGGKAFSQEDNLLYQKDSLKIYKSLAVFKGKEIYNAEKELQSLRENEEESDNCSVDYTYYYNPLSLVGNYYSYEAGEGGIIACGVPGNMLLIKTINLTTSKEVSLRDVFTEMSILQALKSDKWVQQIQNKINTDFSKLNSFTDVLKAINELDYVKFKPNSFTVLKYDANNGNVLVRFVGKEYMGFNHHRHLQLGLNLKPKQEFKHLFKTKTKFTLGEFKNGLTE